ncbi:MAG: hypothetical protein ACE5HQ_08455 [Gemmatimonadota bacterium]
MHGRKLFVWLVAGLAAGVIGTPVSAQEKGEVDLSFFGGVGVPVSDLQDLFDVGPAFGVDVDYYLGSRLAVRLEGSGEALSGVDDLPSGNQPPDLTLVHGTLGLKYRLIAPATSRFSVDVNAGGGITVFSTERVIIAQNNQAAEIDISKTYPAINGGVRIGYDVSDLINVFVGGSIDLTFGDSDELDVFQVLDPSISSFDTFYSIPLVGGISFKFPG